MRLWSGFWGITAAGLLAFFPSLHQTKLRGFICTCVRHRFYKSVPVCTQFSDVTSHFWVDDWEMFFCFLLKEARHLLKKLLSVLNLLVKGSRSCNYNTALMTVSGLIFCFIAAWGIEEGFFLYCFCPIVSLLLSVLRRPQPDVTFISAVALFAAASAQIYGWSLTQYILWVVSSRFLLL